MTAEPNQETTWPTEVERAVLAQHCWCEGNATSCGECDGERAEILAALGPYVARREREAAYAAWSEGRATGWSRAMRFMSNEPDVDTNPPNPYATERATS